MTVFLDAFSSLIAGVGTTLFLTVASFTIGALIAIPVSLCRVSRAWPMRLAATVYIEIARGIPPIAWLFILYFGLTQLDIRLESITAAVIGLGLIAGGYLAEIYRSGMRAVPLGQSEAASSLGITRRAAYKSIIIPQAIITVIPLAATFMIGLLKDSAVASVIGVEDITAIALSLSKREVEGLTIFIAAGAVYLLISVPVALLARVLGARLVRRLEFVR